MNVEDAIKLDTAVQVEEAHAERPKRIIKCNKAPSYVYHKSGNILFSCSGVLDILEGVCYIVRICGVWEYFC